MKSISLLSTLMILFLSACSPFTIMSSSGEQPTPVIETVVPVHNQGYQAIAVDGVEAVVGVGSPIPVYVNVSGALPDTCAQLELIQIEQDGATFNLILSTIPSSAEGCLQDPLPFRVGIPLNVLNLPPGSYAVVVNGVRDSFLLEYGSSAVKPPPAGSPIIKDDVQIDAVDVEIGVGSPLPVHAVVSGNLPNSCAQLGEIRMHRDGPTFFVRIITHIADAVGCQADSLPFRLELPLNIVNLPQKPYEVNVNGATASFDPLAVTADDAPVTDFESRLKTALLQSDSAELQVLMGDPFLFAYWQSEGVSVPAAEAAPQLLESHIPSGSALEFQDFQGIPAFDPQAMLGPDVVLAKTIYVSGWGRDGENDALLLVAQHPDGSFYWHSVLVAPAGFPLPVDTFSCTDPVDVPIVDGKVFYNGISFHLDPTLGKAVAASICPDTSFSEAQAPGVVYPAYTSFTFPAYNRQNTDFQPEVAVYEVTEDMSSYMFPLNMLPELQDMLSQRQEPPTWFDAAPLHSRQEYLGFASGAGVRGVVQYMQDRYFFTNNGLLYEFNGLTEDGRYAVIVRYPLSVPFLMELAGPDPRTNVNPGAIAIPEWTEDYEQQGPIIEAYNAEALERLEQMGGADALPDLAVLDKLVESIQVADKVITLERTVCFGFCPAYTLTIYSDGGVVYEGKQYVDVVGIQTASLTKEQMDELIAAFEKADYFNLEDQYTAPVTDIPSTITSLTIDGRTMTVVNYGGCLEGSPVEAPKALCELELKIDEVVKSSQWIGTP